MGLSSRKMAMLETSMSEKDHFAFSDYKNDVLDVKNLKATKKHKGKK